MSTPKRRKVSLDGATRGEQSAEDVTPKKGKKKQIRDQYSLKDLAEALELQDVAALKEWLGSPIFAKSWNEFVKDGYPKKGKAKKGWELTSVHSHIVNNERHGLRKFSARDAKPALFNDYLDCQAWLLYVLTTENTTDRGGVFFGKNLPEMQRYQRMWKVIGYRIWMMSPSRVATTSAQQPTAPAGNTNNQAEERAQQPAIFDPTKGILRVAWKNIPEAIEDSGDVNPLIIVKQVCSYESLEALQQHISEGFHLQGAKHRIAAFSLDDYEFLNWDDLCRYLHEATGRVNAAIFTEEVGELQMQQAPEALVPTPAEEKQEEQEIRRLLWNEMVSEVVADGATTLDLTKRYWQYVLLQTVAANKGVQLSRVTLKLRNEAISGDEDQAATLAIGYMLTMEDLNKALRRPAGQPPGEQDASDVEADAAGPPATKLREITQEEIANFQEQIRWLQNHDYERDNHGQACAVLDIRNPEVPHLEGMFPAATLRHYQPTGITALVVFEDSEVGGGVLSDEVGTGKTYVVIGLLLYRSNQREDRGKLDIPISRPRVTLLLVPKNLIHSWKRKIMDFTGRFRIVIYYGAAKKRDEHNVEYRGVMTKDDTLFDLTNEENASTIIISTVATWTARHGPRAQNNWKIAERMRTEKVPKSEATKLVDAEELYYEPDPDFPGNVSGLIERLIIDEGHELRHEPLDLGTSIDWVEARYRLIVTATPTRKSIAEFAGIMHYIQNPRLQERKYLESLGFSAAELGDDNHLDTALRFFDPFLVADDDPKAQLRYCGVAMREHVFNKKVEEVEMGRRARCVLRKVLLKRSYASTVNGKRVDQDLPAVQRTTIQCQYTPEEREIYNQLYLANTAKLCRLDGDNDEAKEIKAFRAAGKTATDMLKDVRRSQKKANIDDELLMEVPKADDNQRTLSVLCDGAPKLRTLLHLLSDIVVLGKEKVIIWVQFPAQMEWLRCALAAAGFDDAKCLWPDLSESVREEMVQSFHTDAGGFKILIASFMVSPSGLDLHGHCRNIIEYDPAPDEATRIQIVGRVQRDGQNKWIRHIILIAEGSFDEKRIAVAMLQNLPGLLTQLNLEVWGGGGDGEKEISLGNWVLHDGRLMKENDIVVQGLDLEPLSPQALLLAIQQQLSGQDMRKSLETVKDDAFGRPIIDRLWESDHQTI